MEKVKHLLLFSGGPDSTVLLKYLLNKKDIDLTVFHIQLAYKLDTFENSLIQKERTHQIIKFYKSKGYKFNYVESIIGFNFNDTLFGDEHWADDQWCTFLGAMVCKKLHINNMWTGYFDYTNKNRKKILGHEHSWIFDGTMEKYINMANSKTKINYLNPKTEFKGKSIDKFKSKKEALLYLEPEVRKMVRSCYGSIDFCGKCYKCVSLIKNKVMNKKGELLI